MASPFGTEARLVSSFTALLKASGLGDWRIAKELDTGVGFADLVLFQVDRTAANSRRVLSRISSRLAPLCSPEIARQLGDAASLSQLLGISAESAKRVEAHLQQVGLVRYSGGRRCIQCGLKQPFPMVVAVEAKLSKWQSALTQAYRNLQFADQSWVLLDHASIQPAIAYAERFVRSGVGLAAMSTSGQLYVVVPAPMGHDTPGGMRWQAQAALAKRLARPARTST